MPSPGGSGSAVITVSHCYRYSFEIKRATAASADTCASGEEPCHRRGQGTGLPPSCSPATAASPGPWDIPGSCSVLEHPRVLFCPGTFPGPVLPWDIPSPALPLSRLCAVPVSFPRFPELCSEVRDEHRSFQSNSCWL